MLWTITQLDCYPEVDGDVDVVVLAHWTLTDSQDGYTGKAYGTTAIVLDKDAPFIPYDQLTEAQVIGWVQTALGATEVARYESDVSRQIQNQLNPPIVTPPLPW